MRAVVTVAVLLGVLAVSRPAEAAKLPIVFTSGQESFVSGPLPPPYDQLAGADAGYVCDVSGVFWSYYAIDNCVPAAIKGHEFDARPEIGAAVAAVYPAPSIPFWAAHGWKLMIGAVVSLVAGFVVLRRRRGTDEDEETTDHVRASGPRVNPANLPLPERPPQHVHRPIGSISYQQGENAPHTTLGHAPAQAYPHIVHAHPQAISTPLYEATVVGIAPPHGTPAAGVPASYSAAFGRVNTSDHEAPTVAYGARGYAAPAYVPPAYLNQPYVHEPYVQQRARSFPPVPTFESSGPADDGPTTYDPSAQLRAEQTHAELARGSSPSPAGWPKK